MSCALCPEYNFCELKKSGLDKNAIFIVHNMIWACVPSMEQIGNENVVSLNDVSMEIFPEFLMIL